jgi:hypothetical protein
MRSGWTASTNAGHRLLLCVPLLLIFGPFAPDDALGKGGTNFHESLPHSAFPTDQPTSPSDGFGSPQLFLFSRPPALVRRSHPALYLRLSIDRELMLRAVRYHTDCASMRGWRRRLRTSSSSGTRTISSVTAKAPSRRGHLSPP